MKLKFIAERTSNPGKLRLKSQIMGISSVLAELFTIPTNTRVEDRALRAHDNTIQFWQDPNSKLYRWLGSNNIAVRPGVPAYADGGSGRCYFLDDKNHVVKMSANRVEANVAKMVVGRPDLPTVVVDVTSLDSRIYAILELFVNTNLPAEIKKAADYVMVLVDETPNMVGFPSDKAEQTSLCAGILTRFKGDQRLLPHMLLIMDILSQLYRSTGYKHDDAGPTNIGMYNDKLVIPDLGPLGDQDEKLAEIKRNRDSLGLPDHETI